MIELSTATFQRYLEKRAKDHDESTFRVWNELSLGELDRFWSGGGLSIGGFSKLVGLPVSHVRHYLNQGLIEPYKVGGKYRFHPFNIWEVKSVQHWQELGSTLEKISARRMKNEEKRPGTLVLDVLGPLQILGEEHPEGLVWLRRRPTRGGWHEEVVFGVSAGEEQSDPLCDEIFQELTAELARAGQRLEVRLQELTERLERLNAKQKALGSA